MLARFLTHFRQQYAGFLALFIVLGGTSYAVATNSIGSAQIKNNSIRSKDIRNNEVSSVDVKSGSLLAADFKAGQLPSGARGPAGSPGPTGPAGAMGPQGPKGGPCSSRDLLCRGPKGDTGATGPAGPQGVKGDTGPAGATGRTGPPGPIGERGSPGISGLQRVSATSAFHNLMVPKQAQAVCPSGKRVVGTGAEIQGGRTEAPLGTQLSNVTIDGITPGLSDVTVVARVSDPTDEPWSVTAYALCAYVS